MDSSEHAEISQAPDSDPELIPSLVTQVTNVEGNPTHLGPDAEPASGASGLHVPAEEQTAQSQPSPDHGASQDPSPSGTERGDAPSSAVSASHPTPNAPESVKFAWFAFLLEALGLILAILFLVLGILLAKLNDTPVLEHSQVIVQASKVAASLWPILFAAVMGTAARTLARLLTEKGGKLIQVEHLIGSQTFAGVIFTPIQLRFLHVQSAIVILLWAFNPLGTQAIIRAVEIQDNTELKDLDTPLRFASSDFFSDAAAVFQLMGHEEEFLDPLVAAVLYSPEASLQNMRGVVDDYDNKFRSLGSDTARYGSDTWGNVRIPKLESLPGYDETRPEEWVAVPYQNRLIDYASLIGVRVEGLPRDLVGNVSWSIEANYHNFRCDPWHVVKFKRAEPQNTTNLNATGSIDPFLHKNFRHMFYFYNKTIATQSPDVILSHLFKQRSIFLDTETLGWPVYQEWRNTGGGINLTADWPWYDAKHAFPQRQIFFGMKGYNNIAALTKCRVTLSYVVAEVSSQITPNGTTPLVVNRMRRSSSPHTSLDMHAFQHPLISANISDTFGMLLAYYEQTPKFAGQRPTVPILYVLDPIRFRDNHFLYQGDGLEAYLAANLSASRFEARFGLVFNTYWRAYAHGWGNLNLDRYSLPGDGLAVDVNETLVRLAAAQARILSPAPQTYVTSAPWVAVYFVANAIVFLASMLSLILRSRLRGPDVLGYVSSIVRYSRYFIGNDDTSDATWVVRGAVDGFKATRALRGERILLGRQMEEMEEGGTETAGVGKGEIVLLPEREGRRILK